INFNITGRKVEGAIPVEFWRTHGLTIRLILNGALILCYTKGLLRREMQSRYLLHLAYKCRFLHFPTVDGCNATLNSRLAPIIYVLNANEKHYNTNMEMEIIASRQIVHCLRSYILKVSAVHLIKRKLNTEQSRVIDVCDFLKTNMKSQDALRTIAATGTSLHEILISKLHTKRALNVANRFFLLPKDISYFVNGLQYLNQSS
ncbi:hypothetical protein L9F63_014875, partial [Diploptera punctata]